MFLKSLIEVETLAFMSIACFILTFTHKGSGYIYYFATALSGAYAAKWFFQACGQILKWGSTALADFFRFGIF